MSALIKKTILAISSIVLGVLLYWLFMWSLDSIARYLGSQTTVGNFFVKTSLWLSHFGYGPILLPVIIIFIFYILNKRVIKGVQASRPNDQ